MSGQITLLGQFRFGSPVAGGGMKAFLLASGGGSNFLLASGGGGQINFFKGLDGGAFLFTALRRF